MFIGLKQSGSASGRRNRSLCWTVCVAVLFVCWCDCHGARAQPTETTISQWTLQTRGKLKDEIAARERPEHPGAVIELCELYASMRADSRYQSSATLRGLCAMLRRRLISVKEQLQSELTRDGVERAQDFSENFDRLQRRLRDSIQNTTGQADSNDPPSDPLDSDRDQPSRLASDGKANSGKASDDEASGDEANGGAQGPGPGDGWVLVELITRTIDPSFWNNQGGPGVVYYYGMHRVLAVRATTPVHEDIQQLLNALRGTRR